LILTKYIGNPRFVDKACDWILP